MVVFAAWYLWERLTEPGWDGARRFLVGGGAFALMVTALFVAWPASPDPIGPPDSDAAPALQIAEDAPPEVLDRHAGDRPGHRRRRRSETRADPTSRSTSRRSTTASELVGSAGAR